MKKYILSILAIVLLSAYAGAQLKFTVKGTIVGLPDSTEVALHADNPQNEPIAKVIPKKGNFTLKGSVKEPALYFLTYAYAGGTLSFPFFI